MEAGGNAGCLSGKYCPLINEQGAKHGSREHVLRSFYAEKGMGYALLFGKINLYVS